MKGVIFDFRWFIHLLICMMVIVLIGFTVYITTSIWALLGLLLMPGLEVKRDVKKEDDGDE